jgi:hypothetical protein
MALNGIAQLDFAGKHPALVIIRKRLRSFHAGISLEHLELDERCDDDAVIG